MLIYIYYYGGGDTIAYFYGAKAVSNLIVYDFDKAYDIILNLDTNNNSFSSFNKNTVDVTYTLVKIIGCSPSLHQMDVL